MSVKPPSPPLPLHRSPRGSSQSHQTQAPLDPRGRARILIIDDELPIREVLSAALRDEEYTVATAGDGESGLRAIEEFRPDLVFLDIWMPGSLDGIEVLCEARKKFPLVDYVMISGHGTIETAVKATKMGAWDFIEKPLSMDKISIVISNALQYQQQREEKEALLNKLRRSIALLGDSPPMIELKQMVARYGPGLDVILLEGEIGTGRALVAQNLHYLSERASRPFIELNCGELPEGSEDLINYELYGCEGGILAGTDRPKKGKLEQALGGTLFMADLARMGSCLQEKWENLLREGCFRRVGGPGVASGATQASQPQGGAVSASISAGDSASKALSGGTLIPLDVRLILATERDLQQEVAQGHFRQGLYDRLYVNRIRIPPLRERRSDIPLLIAHFSEQIQRESGYPRKTFSDSALEMMQSYYWPGNVRELRNFVERIYILVSSTQVDSEDLISAGWRAFQSKD